MSEFSELLKERAMSFAVCTLKMVDHLPTTAAGRVVAFQLARSATSVVANFRAACTARSRREYIAKLGLVVEEIDESACWLELIARRAMLPPEEIGPVLDESIQLRKIFGKSLGSARANARLKCRDAARTSPLDQITR